MKTPFSASLRYVLPRSILLALASFTLWLPVGSRAQTAPPAAPSGMGTPEKPTPEKPTPEQPTPEKPTPPLPARPDPANPLVLFNPQDKSGNANRRFDPDGNLIASEKKLKGEEPRDYRRDWDDSRLAPRSKPLPLFGYDFFRPAREIIRARRAYLMRLYESEGAEPIVGSPQTPDRPEKEREGNLPGRNAEDKSAMPPMGRQGEESAPSSLKARNRGKRAADTNAPLKQNQRYGDERDLSDDNAGTDEDATGEDTQEEMPGPFDASGDTMSDVAPYAEALAGRRRLPNRAAQLYQVPDDTANTRASDRSGRRGQNALSQPGDNLPDQDAADLQNIPRRRTGRNRMAPYRMRGYANPQEDQGYLTDQENYSGQEERADYLSRNGLQPDFYPSPVDAYQNVADPLSQLFRNPIASVPPNYQLAPGDVLTIRISSPTQEPQTYTRTVDSRGTISLGSLQAVVVRGLTAEGAEKLLRTQLRRLVKNAEVSVTLSQLRTIQVTVSGAAFLPGTYTVPANTSAYNVLNAAGGPTFDGTLRNIEVRRAGKVVGKLDVYRFLALGEETNEIPLQTGDMIVIPPRQSQVSVSGEVLHPAVFELTPSETLQDALRYAGGVKPSAVDQRIHIKTLVPGTARVVTDVDIKDSATARKTALYDGD
ncbi:MAG TPA: polysaccharide biosynthesis/export family protein, partial [Chthonomonadaceae bacterium]|nr:polysaccharide biosynthesis/export family protein [Chthonomonadaceae bacterium]